MAKKRNGGRSPLFDTSALDAGELVTSISQYFNVRKRDPTTINRVMLNSKFLFLKSMKNSFSG